VFLELILETFSKFKLEFVTFLVGILQLFFKILVLGLKLFDFLLVIVEENRVQGVNLDWIFIFNLINKLLRLHFDREFFNLRLLFFPLKLSVLLLKLLHLSCKFLLFFLKLIF
jgi:hypothetical protein